MMGDYVSNVGNDNTDADASTSSWNVSNISFNDTLEEEPVNVIPKVRSTFTGRSYAGEELQKMLGNGENLNTYVSGSVPDVHETEKPRNPGLPVAPILKYYEIIGPPQISSGGTNSQRPPLPR